MSEQEGVFQTWTSKGMTLREWYAGKLAPVFLAFMLKRCLGFELANGDRERIAEEAFRMADALIAEMEKSHD